MKATRNRLACGQLILYILTFIAFNISVLGASETADSGQHPSAAIYSVSVEPAKVVSGKEIRIEAVFSVFDDSPRSSLSMEYFCEISKHGTSIFRSPEKRMTVVNGAKSHLEIKLQATGNMGDYKVVFNLIRPDGTLREEGAFSIVSPMEARTYRAELLKENPSAESAVENRLQGRWRLESPDPEIPGLNLVISNEGGELAVEVLREEAGTLWVRQRKTENSLLIRSKAATPGGDCWYIMEDVITFNDQMDDMPVRSKVLEGSRCVPVGRVSESILHRTE